MFPILICVLVAVQGITGQSGVPAGPLTVFAIPDEYFSWSAAGVAGGFLKDYLDALTGITGIQFKIVAHPELNYDSPNADGSWTGTLIGEVSKAYATADLVGPDLTFSDAGAKVVDFLVPIRTYTLQIGVNPQFGLNDKVQYLSLDDSDLLSLKNSKNATLNAIYNNVQAGRPGSIVLSNAAGLAKVQTGNFAMIAESVFFANSLGASAGKVVIVGGNLGGLSALGFAVKKGHPLEGTFNNAILSLQTAGTTQALLTKNMV